jgi:hypothetical protein
MHAGADPEHRGEVLGLLGWSTDPKINYQTAAEWRAYARGVRKGSKIRRSFLPFEDS